MVGLHYEDIKLVYSDALGLLRTGSLANHPFWPLICRKEQPAEHRPPGQSCSTIIHPEALKDVYLSLRITSGKFQGYSRLQWRIQWISRRYQRRDELAI